MVFKHVKDNIISINLEDIQFRNHLLKVNPIIRLNIATIIVVIFLMFYQLFPSPQVKRSAIITYKDSIYEMPHEFSNDLRLTILEN